MAANPLHDGLRIEPTPGPTTLVIFGASGDLTRRKLLPAIYHLARGRSLPASFSILGIGRTPFTDEQFRDQFFDSLREFVGLTDRQDEVARSLAAQLRYVQGQFDDDRLYATLHQVLQATDAGVLYYFALPPNVYPTLVERLGAAGLTTAAGPNGWRRVVVEKPFGTDLQSAKDLNRTIHRHFDESQVFRIDHYLGKETVQNLLVFRFANGMFEPIWNRRYIDHVQITAAETVGVERRAGYYDQTGALRDMVQNHLMQLLTLVAMEPPTAFSAESVRDRKMDALLAIQPLVVGGAQSSDVVRGQYGAGWVNGGEVVEYRAEPGVDSASQTETFAALRLNLDSWRWAGVPFFLRTGKRLPKRTTEIAIQLRRPPLEVFKKVSPTPVAPNLVVVNVQPDEEISIRFEAKLPGTRMHIAPVRMNFRYSTTFGRGVPEAYETLLLDAMLGDTTLFARHDFVEASWALITPILEAWKGGAGGPVQAYESGQWGPRAADELIAREGRRWRTL